MTFLPGSLLLRGRAVSFGLSRQNRLLSEAETRLALLRRSAPWAVVNLWRVVGLLTRPRRSQQRQHFGSLFDEG